MSAETDRSSPTVLLFSADIGGRISCLSRTSPKIADDTKTATTDRHAPRTSLILLCHLRTGPPLHSLQISKARHTYTARQLPYMPYLTHILRSLKICLAKGFFKQRSWGRGDPTVSERVHTYCTGSLALVLILSNSPLNDEDPWGGLQPIMPSNLH